MSLNCGHWQAYCSPPRWYMRMENHNGMIMSTEENSWLVHQFSGKPTSTDIWYQVRRMGKRNGNLALQSSSVHTCKLFFTRHRILQHGASGFTSLPEEGVLWIFITLKNPCLSWFRTCKPWVQWQAHWSLHYRVNNGDRWTMIWVGCGRKQL
jgi:hypothetical protein